MANISANRTTGRKTLSGTTIDTVTLAAGADFDVCNWTGTADLTVTYAVGGAVPADPVAGAAETYAVPQSSGRTFEGFLGAQIIVKILGNGNVYSVDARL